MFLFVLILNRIIIIERGKILLFGFKRVKFLFREFCLEFICVEKGYIFIFIDVFTFRVFLMFGVEEEVVERRRADFEG